MKKIIKGIDWLIKNYKKNSDNYIPIYTGERLLDYGKVVR